MRSSTVCSRRAPMLSTELLTSSATRATCRARAHLAFTFGTQTPAAPRSACQNALTVARQAVPMTWTYSTAKLYRRVPPGWRPR